MGPLPTKPIQPPYPPNPGVSLSPTAVSRKHGFDTKFLTTVFLLLLILSALLVTLLRNSPLNLSTKNNSQGDLRVILNQDLNDPAINNPILSYQLTGKVTDVKKNDELKTLTWTVQPVAGSSKPRVINIYLANQTLKILSGPQASQSATLSTDLTQITPGSVVTVDVTDYITQNKLVGSNITWLKQ